MNTREVESKLRCSGGKRVSKIKNCFTSVCHNKKGTKLSKSYRWALFLIFQLFIALLVMQPNAWAGLASLTVDANGDNVFNGDNEKLTITFTTSDFGEDGQLYQYDILVDHNGEKKIFSGPDEGDTLSKNQTEQYEWDGTYLKDPGNPNGAREKLPDGDYTIKVKLLNDLPQDQVLELTEQVILDTKAPEVTISIDDDAFSPILYSLSVYYDIDEDVSEAWLEFQRAPGNANIGRRVPLSTSSGSHTYNWDGEDNNRRAFFDGQYTLRIRVKDRGGNEAESGKTGNITIDTEEPRITSITLNDSIALTNGKFVNAPISTINFTADDPEGIGVNLTGRDTEVLIRPVGGRNLSGAMTFGNKATFTLGDILDELDENGEYEVTAFISDNVGNLASSRVRFTFDNSVPILKSVATHEGEFTAGSGIRGLTNYVEATLEDNIELNLADSTIRLKGPSGSDVLGQQTRTANDKIRWQLLSPLLAKDGIHDGQYTVEVVGADKAGNQTTPIQITFLFDNIAPELVSVSPTRDGEPFNILGDTVYYNLPLNQFVATFDDGEFGTGVIFSGADDISRIIFGTPKTDGGVDAISGRAFPDLNNNVLTYILDDPLLNSDGSQDGSYRLNVKAADPLGNNKIYSFHLIYDTQVPTLASTVPTANQSVQDLSQVVVKLNETTSGIDFVQSVFALKRNMGENQVEVPVNISSNGTDTATLTLLQPIALDGSDDGTYVIEVTPTDRAGNLGAVIRREFYLVSQARPQVKLVTPETGTVNSLGDITVELVDYIGSGINFDASTITVRNAQGQIVPQAEVVAEAATNQLTWNTETAIPKGVADGRYTISASFRDYSGVVITQTFNLNLDTLSPSITSVQVGTDALNQLSLDSTIDVTESFSHIRIEFDATDVDFENTVVTLVDPDSNEITARKSIDGETLLTLSFQNLAKLGSYTLTVTPIDNIGNVTASPFIYKFNIDIAVPVVTSVLIDDQSGAIVYVKGTAGEIIATIADTTGIGIAVGQGESNIAVSSESGLPVPGITTINDENQLIWRPSILPSDGSADGRYTVSVTPVDKAGRTGDVAYRAFIYDTQSPQITAATPISLHQPISYVGDSLEQFQFSVEDVGPALLDLDDQTISLTKKSGEVVAGHITHDNNNQLFFTLPAPLPTDGSADGEYTVTVNLVDKAGNPYQVEHTVVYDSQAPQLASVSLNTETPSNLTAYQVTDLSGSISKITLKFIEMTRIDFDNTVITLMSPDGSTIPLTLENNGIDEITANFVSLIQDGLYTLSVTPQDMSSNVAQGAVPYPFRLKFEVPSITTVHANSVSASYELASYEIMDISDAINSFSLKFTDAERIDFENTSVTLIAPNGQDIAVTEEKSGSNQFLVRFIPLTQSGLYTLSVTPQDIAGNIAQSPIQYQFRLEITLPTVGSVLIDGKLGTNILINDPDTEIIATFADATGVGLAFGDNGSTITVNNEQGSVVFGVISSNGTNQMTWTPAALPTDGSADGRYTVTITPLDKSGRTGTVVTRHFIYDTQAPRITNATPIILHQPMSYIGGNMTPFEFTVEDVGPSLLDLEDQTIGLRNEDGEIVAGHVTNDGVNRIFFTLSTPLPTDGSADGEYSLTINLVDKAGNPNEVVHSIFYDSQVPRLSLVSLNTETPIALTPYQVTYLSESINKLTINFIETTRVDFTATDISLIGPSNSTIALTLENNGVDQVSVRFVTLTQGGLYTLSVTPQDIAGNVAQGAVSYPFRLKFEIPGLASVKANTADDSLELIQHEIVETSELINSLTLEFTDPLRVDFEKTNVSLSGPDGQEIIVTLEDNESSQLIVRFVPLEQSGLYTLSVTPQDNAGNIAQNAVSYQFRLEFVMPEIASVKVNTADTSLALTPYEIIELSEPVNGFTLEFTNGSRVDFENTSVILTAPDGQQIPVILEDDEDAKLSVRFVALEQSGLYTLTITPQDIEGTVAQNAVSYQLRLEFDMPEIASVKVNTADTSLALTPYEIIELSEPIGGFTLEFTNGARVDFENTSVVLTAPDGQQIPIILEDDEDAKLSVRFVALEQSGLYTLTITPQDIEGTVAQNAVSYQLRLEFDMPEIASVKVNTADTSLALTPYEIIELSEPVGGFTLEFTNGSRVDFENTSVILTAPDGQQIPIILEDDEDAKLSVRFVALEQSGLYTLTITPQDIEGTVAQNAVSYQLRLEFDMPEITSVKVNTADTSLALTPYEIIELSEPVGGFTLEFTNGARVDFENTSVVLTAPDGQQIPVILEDDEDAKLSVRFVALEQSGLYTLTITPQDIEGTVAQNAVSYQLRLEFDMPEIASVKVNTADTSLALTPYEIIELSEPVNGFTLEFTNGARVDFENTSVVLTAPDGQQIPVILEDDEDAKLSVRFVALEQSGLYTLTITPQDIEGTVAQNAVSYQLRLEFDMPEIASVKVNTADTSLALTPYEIIELSEPVNGFTLEFTNGARVDFENTSVVLTAPDGQQIPIILEDDEDAKLSVRFVALEQSGLYTLTITPQDIEGTVAQNAVSYQLRLEFDMPDLESVTAHADDTSVVLIQHDVVEISESIGSLTLKFTDAQRVDFVNTTVTLSDPNGQEIPVTLEDNENSQLTVRFVLLTQSGIYTISVTPQDIAGNVAQTAIRYQFRLDTTLPTVDSVLIDGKVGSTVYVRTAVPRIIAAITDSLGVGLSVGDTGSTIVVTNSQGIQVSATTTLNVANQLTWIPIPLPVDGSADGEYTVVITPVDKAGRTGTVVRRQFIYDTQAPRITSATPITLHAPISYLGSGLNQFVLTVEDVGPADIVYASQVVALMDATGKPLPAKLTYDELTNQLYLTLDTPFASDGTADGPYTLNVLLIDKAGNRLSTRFNLVYDSIIPQVSSVQVNTAGTPIELSPSQVAELSESVDTITIKFNEATRVDFENTSILLLDPNDQTIPLTVGDDGVSQMTLSFVALTQIGQYTLSVTPQDIAGNAAQSPIQYAFNLEFILPDVESIIIGDTITLGSADTAYVNADNLVIAANLLDPAGTGLSFDPIAGSEIIVATLDGTIIPGSVATNGTDLLVWRPITLSNDGSSDGRYAVYVYAVDKKGRDASAVYREFVYDTQEPEITNASPMDLSQPVSYISESLTQFQFTIQDVGPADLVLEDQVVTLRNQSGVLVPTKLTNDTNNQLFLTLDEPLPLDGSRDGQYTVEITFSDRSENVLSINHPIVYDTQAPTLVSTVPADNEQLTEDITQIQVSLDDKGESGIDWSRTTVTLIDPNGITISGDLSSDGKSQLTLKTNQLVADGRYVIQVQAIDRAGNGGRTVHESDFLLSRRLPAIVSTVPITAPRDEAYTNQEVDEIEVLLETVDTRHLSTVRLLNAEGQVIAGQQHRETGKLIYRLVRPLTTDGSEDGDYTIEFTPISSSGRSGAAQSLVFTYDTQSPELDPKDVHLIVAEQEVDNSLVRIRLDITDNHAGVDWENLDTDWVTFERISPDSDDIDGSVQYVSDEPEHLIFTLNVPLADDGSADGKYRITVTPIDKAGNGDETYEKEFTYDTSPPIIDPNSLLLNDAPLLTDIDADDYPSAVSTTGGVVIQAVVSDTGLGVNLSQSRISVRSPNNQELSGTTRQNGVDTLVFKSDGLNIEGIYQVTVTATGNDTELLGITPQGSITTAFLYETTEPTAVVTDDGGKTELTDEALPLVGTATDPEGVRRTGQQGENEIPVPASGVWLVEIVGTGPDGQPIEPVPAEDDSDAQQAPWSRWTADFLPTRSGDYDLDIRVTDRAGNYAVYDYGEVTMSVSFTFSGNTFVWPNPLRQSNDDVGFFSYELNTSDDTVKLGLYIYDWSGDMVYSKTYDRIEPGHRNGNEVSWQLKNSAGNRVARGIYVFRLEAVDGAGNRANAVGKILVVD